MLFHFKDKFPQLAPYWDKYLEFQKRMEVPAKTVLLAEGKVSGNYIFIEKGCIRLAFNNNGNDKTVQFFFENEGLTSFESFLKNTPSLFTIETIEPSVVYLLPKVYVNKLMTELSHEPDFVKLILEVSAERQLHYMHEFVSFIRDTPEQRYQNLLNERPYIVKRVPQHYIASYLGISRVHLSRIKAPLPERSNQKTFGNICYRPALPHHLTLYQQKRKKDESSSNVSKRGITPICRFPGANRSK